MASTKHDKIEFGRNIRITVEMPANNRGTQRSRSEQAEAINIIGKETDGRMFSGYRKVNYAEKRMQETYQKVNKMLGGN